MIGKQREKKVYYNIKKIYKSKLNVERESKEKKNVEILWEQANQ